MWNERYWVRGFKIGQLNYGYRLKDQRQSKTRRPQEEEGFRRLTHFRRSTAPMYQTIFLYLFYSCNNFGHKVLNWRENNRNRDNHESYDEMIIQEGLVKLKTKDTTSLNP
jgi:hypothetical protein